MKLVEIVDHFKEVEHFTVETDYSSGIGVGVVVSFSIDITDVKEW